MFTRKALPLLLCFPEVVLPPTDVHLSLDLTSGGTGPMAQRSRWLALFLSCRKPNSARGLPFSRFMVVCRVLAFFLRGPPSCSGCCGANPGCVTPLRRCSRGEFPAWKGRSTAQASTDPRREEGLYDLSKKGALRSPALSPFFRPTVAGAKTLQAHTRRLRFVQKRRQQQTRSRKTLLMPLAKGRQRYGPR